MKKPNVLWLIWQNVDTRQRYHVASLTYDNETYTFEYEHSKEHRGLSEAIKNGYRPHVAFPDLRRTYISRKLFGPFLRRLPNSNRPDFMALLKKYGIKDNYTDMDLLRITGGRLGTDNYEFVEPICFDDENFEINFYIAGWSHYKGDERIHLLSSGSLLFLEKEPENEHDPFAVKIKMDDGFLLGYVPAFYSEFLTKVLDNKIQYHLQIKKIDQEAIPQFKVNLLIEGELQHPGSIMFQHNENLIPLQKILA